MKTIIKHFTAAGLMALVVMSCKKNNDKDNTPDPPVSNSKLISIAELKLKYSNAALTLEENIKIKGVVISDLDNGNIVPGQIVIQEASDKPGIIINLQKGTHTFKSGDVVEVAVSRQKLDKVEGELSIVGLALDSIRKTGTGNIQPRVVTAKQLQDNADAWNATLVTINNGLFDTGNEIFMGTVDFTDATGTVKSTTLQTASFYIRPLPYHEANLNGIVRKHSEEINIDMRSWYITFFDIATADYKPVYTITEDFQQWGMPSNPLKTGVWLSYGFSIYGKSTIKDGSYSSRASILRGIIGGSYLTIPMFKGLKSVTIVFSGSLTDTAYGTNSTDLVNLPFSTTRDYVGAKLSIINYGGLVEGTVYKMNEVGKFHTVTFLVKKEDLATMDIDVDTNARVTIKNASSGTRNGKATAIVIDKVVLGFDQKDPGIDATLWDK